MKLAKLITCSLTFAVLAFPGLVAAKTPGASSTGLFGSLEFVSQAPRDWFRLLIRLRTEQTVFENCAASPGSCPSQSVLSWLAELDDIRRLGPLGQVDAVNRRVNRWTYKTDLRNFGMLDFWASPIQFLSRSGDCEDFVVFKYFALKLLGFDDRHLKIVLVRDTVNNADHAVLAVYLNGQIYILDSNLKDIVPHDRLKQYLPLLSFSAMGSWGHVARRDTL